MPRYGCRIVVLVALVAVGVCGCSRGTTAARKRLSIATGGTGGVFYPYGGAIARVISENLGGVKRLTECVERAGPDVAEDHPEGAQ